MDDKLHCGSQHRAGLRDAFLKEGRIDSRFVNSFDDARAEPLRQRMLLLRGELSQCSDFAIGRAEYALDSISNSAALLVHSYRWR